MQKFSNTIETFVYAANKTGKTRIAAVVALWFFFSRTPARIVVSSSTESQLRHILWNEILHLIQISTVKFPFLIRDLSIRKLQNPQGKRTQSLLPETT